MAKKEPKTQAESAAQEPEVAKKEPKTQAESAAQEPEVVLVPMVKDGECIEVHPSCVADHQRLGWAVKD